RLETQEPYSTVELGTGAFQTRLLRAIFSRGFGDRSIATGAFDIVSTDGIGIDEPYRQSNAAFRWGYALGESTGLGVEWRRTTMDRQQSEYPQQLDRSDLILRARRSLTDRLTLEALAGRSVSNDEAFQDSVPREPFRTMQGALRA